MTRHWKQVWRRPVCKVSESTKTQLLNNEASSFQAIHSEGWDSFFYFVSRINGIQSEFGFDSKVFNKLSPKYWEYAGSSCTCTVRTALSKIQQGFNPSRSLLLHIAQNLQRHRSVPSRLNPLHPPPGDLLRRSDNLLDLPCTLRLYRFTKRQPCKRTTQSDHHGPGRVVELRYRFRKKCLEIRVYRRVSCSGSGHHRTRCPFLSPFCESGDFTLRRQDGYSVDPVPPGTRQRSADHRASVPGRLPRPQERVPLVCSTQDQGQ